MATKGKDLRSGRYVWQGPRAPDVAHERLARDLKADVLIMGAGITGAAIATGETHRSSRSLARSEKKRPSGGGHYRRGDRAVPMSIPISIVFQPASSCPAGNNYAAVLVVDVTQPRPGDE